MIVLQENSGEVVFMENWNLPASVRTGMERATDALAENFMSLKASLQAAGKYNEIINLTDNACTRQNLLTRLVMQARAGNTVDLYIFGHGSDESLSLKTGELTGGAAGNIRSLLADARRNEGANFNFTLRLVYMVNCFGGTTNDDWLAIGAKTSIGAKCINWMPEPMVTIFTNKFVNENKPAPVAAAEAFAESSKAWYLSGAALGYYEKDKKVSCDGKNCFETSMPFVEGNRSLKFSPSRTSQTGLVGNGYEDVVEGTYYIISVASGKYLDARSDSHSENGTAVQVYDGSTAADKKWKLEKVSGLVGGYTFKNIFSGKVLDADAFHTDDNGCKVQLWDRNAFGDRRHQEWYVKLNADGGYFEIINVKNTQKLLDAHNDIDENGKKVKLWSRRSNDKTQQWHFVKVQ